MDTATKKTDELEQGRQGLVQEMVAEFGPAWTAQYRPGSFGCHELLDRSLLTAKMVEEIVLNHPACIQNPDWCGLAHTAARALHDLYQRIGAEHLTAATTDWSEEDLHELASEVWKYGEQTVPWQEKPEAAGGRFLDLAD